MTQRDYPAEGRGPSFWPAVVRRAAQAHASGAMYRIESEPHLVHDAGVDFVVRMATEYQAQLKRQPKPRPGNPFIDPDPELLVTELSHTHRALLVRSEDQLDDVKRTGPMAVLAQVA